MNERFLFRGKRKDNGEWVQGFYLELKDELIGEKITRHCILDNIGRTLNIDPATLGQCTGLRDKNGTLIFEGDIVRAKHGTGYIKWHDKGLTGWLVEYADCRELVYSDNRQEYEVIGNIHDNLELLEVQ